jgi:hypothetical protein
VGGGKDKSIYRTADGEFEVIIRDLPRFRDGSMGREISLSRVLPDPTPSNSFDDYRVIKNTFKVTYKFDSTRAELSVDIPRLRTALLALLDTTFQGRVISGEK